MQTKLCQNVCIGVCVWFEARGRPCTRILQLGSAWYAFRKFVARGATSFEFDHNGAGRSPRPMSLPRGSGRLGAVCAAPFFTQTPLQRAGDL